MLSTIPIFIVARGNNDMKLEKNMYALKFSYVFIQSMGLFNQTYIISDNQEVLDFAKRLGFLHTIHHDCKTEKDVRYLEYNAIHYFGKKYKVKPDWFIILSIDEIFANSTLIRECIKNISDKYDVITSYTEISDRSRFFLNKEDKLDSGVHRITNEKIRVKMADAAIYAVKTSFAEKCMEQDDPAVYFWNGNFKFFKNMSVFTDINSIDDILKYRYVGNIIEKVK